MIHVIIPVHNRREITGRLLERLSEQTSSGYRIIVVDDGSTDGTSEMIESRFPNVTLLHGDGNLWWTGATNLGLKHVMEDSPDNDYAMLLNDDLVVNDDFIESALELTKSYPDTLIQAVELDADNPEIILNGGWKIDWLTAKFSQINVGKKITDFDKHHFEPVSTQTGRGTLIPVGVIRELGLYNSRHYPQCGDFEFPVRAGKKGYRLIMHYGLRIYSFSDASCDVNTDKSYSLSDIIPYYFEIRSYAYLPSRFWFAYDTSTNLIRGTIFLVFDLFRVTAYFIRNLRL